MIRVIESISMEIVKISLFLSIALSAAYAYRQTVELKLTYVQAYAESIDEYDDFNLGVELKTMDSVVDNLNDRRSYRFGKRKSSENRHFVIILKKIEK